VGGNVVVGPAAVVAVSPPPAVVVAPAAVVGAAPPAVVVADPAVVVGASVDFESPSDVLHAAANIPSVTAVTTAHRFDLLMDLPPFW
jgi:hypothetical protein